MNPRTLLIFIPVLLSACGSDTWEGFVYPDRTDLSEHRNVGVFESLEECRSGSYAMLRSLGATDRGDYECGLNCELPNGYSTIKVCDETKR